MKRGLVALFLTSTTLISYSQVQKWENWQSNLNITDGSPSTSPTSRNVGLNLWTDRGFGAELHYRNNMWGTALYTRNSNEAIWLGNYANYNANETQQQKFNPWMTLLGGKVGIGTPSPLYNLHIYGDNPSLNIENNNGNGGMGSSLVFGHSQQGTTPLASISSYLIDGSSNLRTGRLLFKTATGGTLTSKMILNEFGRLGIGTIDPSNKLEVQGGGIYASDYISTPGRSYGNGFILPWSNYGDDGLYYENDNNTSMMKLKTNSYPVDIASNGPGRFIKFSTNGNEERMRIDDQGTVDIKHTLVVEDRIFATNKIVIGSGVDYSKLNNYSLAINGNAIANKLVIKTYPNWPDYVFEPAYNLTSLSTLEAYISKFKHLPDVPSSKEIEKEGLDVGATQAALLKKIEELTLYVIDLKKEIDEIKKLNKNYGNK